MNKLKKVAVVKEVSRTGRGIRTIIQYKTIRRFNTITEAEQWIGNLKDQKSVVKGKYQIDAPEE